VHAQRGELEEVAHDDAQLRALGPRSEVDAWRRHEALEMLAQHQWRAALIVLDGSLPAVLDQPHPLFLRALALTHLGQFEAAVAALRQAIADGFRDMNRLETTEDLKPLRNRDDFKRLQASMQRN
jgi:hypothetical protein